MRYFGKMIQWIVINWMRELSFSKTYASWTQHPPKLALGSMETMLICQSVMLLLSGYVQDCWPHGWESVAYELYNFNMDFYWVMTQLVENGKTHVSCLAVKLGEISFNFFNTFMDGVIVSVCSSQGPLLWHFSSSHFFSSAWVLVDFPLISPIDIKRVEISVLRFVKLEYLFYLFLFIFCEVSIYVLGYVIHWVVCHFIIDL